MALDTTIPMSLGLLLLWRGKQAHIRGSIYSERFVGAVGNNTKNDISSLSSLMFSLLQSNKTWNVLLYQSDFISFKRQRAAAELHLWLMFLSKLEKNHEFFEDSRGLKAKALCDVSLTVY